MMVPEFEDAAFTLDVGGSGVVETDFAITNHGTAAPHRELVGHEPSY